MIDTETPTTAIPSEEQTPARMVAGALAHLATHMATGCQRAAYLASMLLERIANDAEADDHLRRHARELVDILDGDNEQGATSGSAAPGAASLHGNSRAV